MEDNKPIPSHQLTQCDVCNLDPVPQSTQYLILFVLEVAVFFVSWKLAIILIMIGYSFPKTIWKCPFCSRQIPVNKQNNPTDSIFLRFGKCMALFSLNKFRIFAAAIAIWMIYLFLTEKPRDPRQYVTKTWQSMANDCGFETYIQNSLRSNRIYDNYLDSGFDWELQGIFLSRQPTNIQNYENIYIKMNPTQFKDPNAYDFKAFTNIMQGIELTRGQILHLKGEWEGRQYHNFIFNPIAIQKTGQTKDPASVSFLYQKNSLLRSHLDAVKQQIELQTN